MTTEIKNYLLFCKNAKKLDKKTLKAYSIDLAQFEKFYESNKAVIGKSLIIKYIELLNREFKPRTVKRKIATLKAYYYCIHAEDSSIDNPFKNITFKIKEPFQIPRTVKTCDLVNLLSYPKKLIQIRTLSVRDKVEILRDIAVLELLFCAGLRVSELCNLRNDCVNLNQSYIKIMGKGNRERVIEIPNKDLLDALMHYHEAFGNNKNQYFFNNRLGKRISEQSIRFMIKRYCKDLEIADRITPHMFRHTFATLLLEEDVDIRYIQHILGHSSITTTQIYTHISSAKQRDILTKHHPRNRFPVSV